MKLELVSGSFPGWCPGSILRRCQSSPDRIYHITNLSWPHRESGRSVVWEKWQPQKRELIKDICLQKIKAQFWGKDQFSMYILGSSVLSSFLKEKLWLRKTNEESILEKCAQRGAQNCTSIVVMFWFFECLPRISRIFYNRRKTLRLLA